MTMLSSTKNNSVKENAVLANRSPIRGFSIVVAEALAAKTPCIMANTSALAEWVDNKSCFGIC